MIEMSMSGYTKQRPQADLKKWQVAYRTKSGSFGIVGYVPLFKSKKDAEQFGEQFKAQHGYVTEIIVQHPSKMYSSY